MTMYSFVLQVCLYACVSIGIYVCVQEYVCVCVCVCAIGLNCVHTKKYSQKSGQISAASDYSFTKYREGKTYQIL